VTKFHYLGQILSQNGNDLSACVRNIQRARAKALSSACIHLCPVDYTHKTNRRTKVFAVVQNGDYYHNTVPATNSASAITKDFCIKGWRGKKSRNGVAAAPNHPRYRLVPCSARRETCLVVPILERVKILYAPIFPGMKTFSWSVIIPSCRLCSIIYR
jgi:hypothetical protein